MSGLGTGQEQASTDLSAGPWSFTAVYTPVFPSLLPQGWEITASIKAKALWAGNSFPVGPAVDGSYV